MNRTHLRFLPPLLLAALLVLLLAGLAAAGGPGVGPAAAPPIPETNITFDSDVLSVAVQGDYAYVGIENIENGLVILDITNPLRPVTLGHVRTLGIEFIDFLDEQTLVVSDNTSIGVLDVTNPHDPVWISPMTDYDAPPSTIRAMKYFDGYLYVVGDCGFSIFDLRAPSSPQVVYTTDNPCDWVLYDVDVALNSHDGHTYAYMAGDTYTGAKYSLAFIDVTDPVTPTIVYSNTDILTAMTSLAVRENRLYLGSLSYDFAVRDITTPAHPVLMGVISLPDVANAMALGVDKVYTAGYDTLLTVDIQDPSRPQLVLEHGDVHPKFSIAFSAEKNCIFLPEGAYGLRILCEAQAQPRPPSLVWLPLFSQRAN